MKKRTIGCVAVLAGSLVLGSTLVAQQSTPAAAPAAAAAPAVDPNKVVMKVGDTTMTAGQFEDFVSALPPEVQQMARGPAKRKIGEDLMKLKLLAGEARKQGLDKSEKFKQQMQLMADNALAGALINQVSTKLVTDADVQKFYDDHKAEYERATVRHILVAIGGDKAVTDAQAKAKADQLKARLDKGEDFAAIAKAESDDPGSKEDGGELQPFGRGQMVPEFEQVAFTQKEGTISAPVKTKFGYHIIQTKKLDTAPLEEVKDEIAEQLKPQKIDGMVQQLKAQAKPELDESFFGPAAPAAPAPADKPAAK
ncbi:MAG: peptidylprolyl isomerase [Bacillota bacterium]